MSNTKYDRLDDDDLEVFEKRGMISSHPRAMAVPWGFIHLITIVSYTFAYLVLVNRVPYVDHTDQIYSPARSAQIYQKILFKDDIAALNPYRGPPRPELDAAWADLVKYSNIRVSADDLRAINRTSVLLSDNSGMYMSELNVHHQLHCLKMIRQAFYPEYYTERPMRHMEEHLDHCIDNIRMALMCKADISLQTYDWLDDNRRPFANFEIEHDCFNWDSVNEWAMERSFDLYDNETLLHPIFGPSFPVDEHGRLIVTDDADPLDGNIITPPV